MDFRKQLIIVINSEDFRKYWYFEWFMASCNQFENLKFDERGHLMKIIRGRLVFLILSIIIPFLYLSMYLPIWNGKELVLANSGKLGIVFFVFQCICLLYAILCLCFNKIRNSNSCLLSFVSFFFFITSLVITVFFGYIFILELLNVSWFPAQR